MIVTSTITMDTDCGRTPLEHLRAIEATANNDVLGVLCDPATHPQTIQDGTRSLLWHRTRIELYNELIKLERKS